MWGFTVYGRDGGEAYTSEPEYETFNEAYAEGEGQMMDMNEGCFEVWKDD